MHACTHTHTHNTQSQIFSLQVKTSLVHPTTDECLPLLVRLANNVFCKCLHQRIEWAVSVCAVFFCTYVQVWWLEWLVAMPEIFISMCTQPADWPRNVLWNTFLERQSCVNKGYAHLSHYQFVNIDRTTRILVWYSVLLFWTLPIAEKDTVTVSMPQQRMCACAMQTTAEFFTNSYVYLMRNCRL